MIPSLSPLAAGVAALGAWYFLRERNRNRSCASRWTLLNRVRYGGRKGRRAAHRLGYEYFDDAFETALAAKVIREVAKVAPT